LNLRIEAFSLKKKSAFLLLKEIDAIVKPINFPLLLCKGPNLFKLFQKNILSRVFHRELQIIFTLLVILKGFHPFKTCWMRFKYLHAEISSMTFLKQSIDFFHTSGDKAAAFCVRNRTTLKQAVSLSINSHV